MNLQHERITHACEALSLQAIAEQYSTLAQQAASDDVSYVEFLERCLNAEQEDRRARISFARPSLKMTQNGYGNIESVLIRVAENLYVFKD